MAGNYGDVPQLLKEQQLQHQQQQQQQQQQMQQQQQQQQQMHQHQIMPQQQQAQLQQQASMAQQPPPSPHLHHQQMPIPTPQTLPPGIQPHQLPPHHTASQLQQQRQQHMLQMQQSNVYPSPQQQQATPRFQTPLPQQQHGMPARGPTQLQRTPLQPLPPVPQQQGLMSQSAGQPRPPHPMPSPHTAITHAMINSQASAHDQNPSKEINTFRFCTIGMQLVQEIIQKTLDLFYNIKSMHLPNGLITNQPALSDKRLKFIEHRENLVLDFRKLRVIYAKVSFNTAVYAKEDCKSLLPYITEGEEDNSSANGAELEDSAEIKFYKEQLKIKNGQLKCNIDEMRRVVFEINAMLDMKR